VELAQAKAAERQQCLQTWGLGEPDLKRFATGVDVRIITPGSDAGEPLHVLSSLAHAHEHWQRDPTATRASLSAAISLVLRLVGLDPDPAKSRQHVFLAVLAEHLLNAGQPADLTSLVAAVMEPPIERVGALKLSTFISNKERGALAANLNSLLASPSFATWRQGAALNIGEWMTPKAGKTPAVIVSVAHLDDD